MIATMLTIARNVQAAGDAPGHGRLGEQQDKQKVQHEGLPACLPITLQRCLLKNTRRLRKK